MGLIHTGVLTQYTGLLVGFDKRLKGIRREEEEDEVEEAEEVE